MTDPHFSASPDVCGLEGLPAMTPDSIGLQGPFADSLFDLGAPGADLEGDGFMEAVTLEDARGLTVFTDSDGDGSVDHVSTVRFDGSYDSWRLAGTAPEPPDGPAEAAAIAPARWERIDHGWI